MYVYYLFNLNWIRQSKFMNKPDKYKVQCIQKYSSIMFVVQLNLFYRRINKRTTIIVINMYHSNTICLQRRNYGEEDGYG